MPGSPSADDQVRRQHLLTDLDTCRPEHHLPLSRIWRAITSDRRIQRRDHRRNIPHCRIIVNPHSSRSGHQFEPHPNVLDNNIRRPFTIRPQRYGPLTRQVD